MALPVAELVRAQTVRRSSRGSAEFSRIQLRCGAASPVDHLPTGPAIRAGSVGGCPLVPAWLRRSPRRPASIELSTGGRALRGAALRRPRPIRRDSTPPRAGLPLAWFVSWCKSPLGSGPHRVGSAVKSGTGTSARVRTAEVTHHVLADEFRFSTGFCNAPYKGAPSLLQKSASLVRPRSSATPIQVRLLQWPVFGSVEKVRLVLSELVLVQSG
jgi:hypothetical protein